MTAKVINDGFPTRVTFSLSSSVLFKAKSVTPPGIDGGGPNDTTTMENDTYKTMQPKVLVTLTPMTLEAAYDPELYDSIQDMMNIVQTITVHFPKKGSQTVAGDTLAFKGWINDFKPGANTTAGEQPTASITIQPSNADTSGAESDPVWTTGS